MINSGGMPNFVRITVEKKPIEHHFIVKDYRGKSMKAFVMESFLA